MWKVSKITENIQTIAVYSECLLTCLCYVYTARRMQSHTLMFIDETPESKHLFVSLIYAYTPPQYVSASLFSPLSSGFVKMDQSLISNTFLPEAHFRVALLDSGEKYVFDLKITSHHIA